LIVEGATFPLKRISYYDKYKDLYKRWSIKEESILTIISDYSFRLVEELSDDEPWKIDNFFRDDRLIEEYIFDLLEGQMIEEFICEWFREKGYAAEKVGSDAQGRLVRSKSSKITTKPDLLVNNKYIEIQISRRGRLKHYHIKKDKGDRISKQLNTLMFIVEDEYLIIDKGVIDKSRLIKNPCWGNKLCYEICDKDIIYNKL